MVETFTLILDSATPIGFMLFWYFIAKEPVKNVIDEYCIKRQKGCPETRVKSICNLLVLLPPSVVVGLAWIL